MMHRKYKLEKQVSFLEKHTEYAATAHLCPVCDSDENIIEINIARNGFVGDIHFKDVLNNTILKKGGTNATSWASEYSLKSTSLLLKQSLLKEEYFYGKRNTERKVVQCAAALLFGVIREKEGNDDKVEAVKLLKALPFRIKLKILGYSFLRMQKK